MYFNNVDKIKEVLKGNYKKYDEKFYISISNNKMNSFNQKINQINSLLGYDFFKYYEDKDKVNYLIDKSNSAISFSILLANIC